MKAWCAWANSTLLLLLMLAIRQKSLDYSHFSMFNLKKLLFPDPKITNLSLLTRAFERNAKQNELKHLKDLDDDPIRHEFDEASAKILGFDIKKLKRIRELISREPMISQ